jgi:hypothetical protein
MREHIIKVVQVRVQGQGEPLIISLDYWILFVVMDND